MHNALGQNTHLTYCTNVHAGPTYEQTLENLDTHALAVKAQVCPDQPMGVGLWLAGQAARKVVTEDRADEMNAWLEDRGLCVRTLNGFPLGDFHQDRVKHHVYQPDWSQPRRLDYTRDLVSILLAMLPPEGRGTISTLPVGWPALMNNGGSDNAADLARLAGQQLRELARELAILQAETGKHIHIALEPEPGCWFDTSQGAVDFFKAHLLGGDDEPAVRNHLGVCHDVCHAAVMFESQNDAFARYAAAGIRVGKVQISSAINVDFDDLSPADRTSALHQLSAFAEDRYLHQTVIRQPDGQTTFHDDLPDALQANPAPTGRWRVHFHVPIHLQSFDLLNTTREQIEPAIRAALDQNVEHFEVETYAWGVLPESLARPDLAAGITDELHWARKLIHQA